MLGYLFCLLQRLMVEMRLGLPQMNIPAPRKRWPGEDDLSDEAEREGLVGRAKELKQGLDHLCGTLKQKKNWTICDYELR